VRRQPTVEYIPTPRHRGNNGERGALR